MTAPRPSTNTTVYADYGGVTWEADIGATGELIIYPDTPTTVALEFLHDWISKGFAYGLR